MATRTITIESLIEDFAGTIADEAGLDAADYEPTADGLAKFLKDAAEGFSPTDQEWLGSAAENLNAIARLGDDGPKTQQLMKSIDSALYQVYADLA